MGVTAGIGAEVTTGTGVDGTGVTTVVGAGVTICAGTGLDFGTTGCGGATGGVRSGHPIHGSLSITGRGVAHPFAAACTPYFVAPGGGHGGSVGHATPYRFVFAPDTSQSSGVAGGGHPVIMHGMLKTSMET